MLTKTKNIRKKSKNIFFPKMKNSLGVWPIGHNNQNLKEIRALGSEKIAPQTDGRTDDGQKPHTMSSADRVKQS